MSLLGRLITRLYKLPPAETHDVVVDHDLQVPMRDGVILLADRYHARDDARRPTILMRSPYGRSAMFGLALARPLAERGFTVLVQSCRGTFGSGGRFDPFHHERDDGLATLDWIERQPWFDGKIATLGGSYLGYVQWAIAADAGERLSAMSAQVTAADLSLAIHAGGSFWLDTALFWISLVNDQEKGFLRMWLTMQGAPGNVKKAAQGLPLRAGDERIVGQEVPYFRDWVDHERPSDPWWRALAFTGRTEEVTAPALLTAGWYDVFLPQTIADHERLRRAGKTSHLTVGPWFHLDQEWMQHSLRESIAWFRAHLLGDPSGLRELPVRLFVMGKREWRDFSEWPPPGVRYERWHLQPEGGLSTAPPPASPPDRYRYDPADPTPSVGGSTLLPAAGARDNAPLLRRRDVLVYTGAPLDADLTVVGPVSAELVVESSLEYTDFFVRLCDTSPSGKTINVCDGLVRLFPGEPARDERGRLRVKVELWPTAHCFRKGHRVRVLVASGAHPRFARNTGSGEPAATATRLVAADQTVHHAPDGPSAIVLPVLEQG